MSNQLLDDVLQSDIDVKELKFPLIFTFKIGTLANDFVASDNNGDTVAFVRQKLFKFKDAIQIFNNDSKSQVLYEIKADRIIDFNVVYHFTDANQNKLGSIGRKGMRSLWKASYDILDSENKVVATIKEENPWAKVMDALLGEIPLLSMLSGYLFNPRYLVSDLSDNGLVRIAKEKSFFGRKFKVTEVSEVPAGEDIRIVLALMMMVLLERRRG